ncbi:glycosyltransferase family 4 protein [Colwellia sp. MB3u-55]|jgi:glycosyltransferase involved in cell wall biosynthesis|nr:glycosyltransferase family 4 protein [Colwellia sp. MB3u-55]
MRKKLNIMLGTAPDGNGGIATVVNGLIKDGFFRDNRVTYLSTHVSYKSKLGAFIKFSGVCINFLYLNVICNVQVVHIHMASRGSYARKSVIIRLASLFRNKIIIHLHGAEFKEFYSDECSYSKQKNIRNSFNLSDKIIVLSTQWRDWVRTIVEEKYKVCVVYNAVPEVVLPCKKLQQENILFLGRLGQRKGVEDLINAFAKVASKFPNSQLQLGGDGDLTKYQTQVSSLGLVNQVTFLGWVSGETKNQCLADATIYCLPSYNEGFPMGILEAMSAGVAVVASKAGGIPDAITDQIDGLLIDAGDVDSLAEALITMLEDSDKRCKLSASAKEKYQLNFCPEVIVPQLEAIYQELLSKPK